ncbi:MAG: helix-turn-helix transcriptional regulator [Planctomycetes bacterium]|nr:helix-turn-helix transcriptional regulator [Planctomycetota bacterium]
MSPLIIEGLALEMLGEIGRKPAVLHEKTPPPWLSDARDLLREQFSQRLTIHEIAQAVGVHPVHLAREFRRFYGYTVGGFVRHLRLVYSCKKLVQSRMPLREIALAGGFFDQSHFARTFKRHFGKTPEDYRRAFQHPGSDRLQPYQRPEA